MLARNLLLGDPTPPLGRDLEAKAREVDFPANLLDQGALSYRAVLSHLSQAMSIFGRG